MSERSVPAVLCLIDSWKNSGGFNKIYTHDLCNASAVLYQLSYEGRQSAAGAGSPLNFSGVYRRQ